MKGWGLESADPECGLKGRGEAGVKGVQDAGTAGLHRRTLCGRVLTVAAAEIPSRAAAVPQRLAPRLAASAAGTCAHLHRAAPQAARLGLRAPPAPPRPA